MSATDVRTANGGAQTQQMPLRRPWRLLGQIAISIAVDVVLLMLFARAGTIPYDVAVLYAIIAGGCVVAFFVVLHSEWAQRQADPALTRAQLLTSSAVELGFALYSPPLAFYFFNMLFLIFAFAALRLRLQQMLSSFVIVTLAGVLTHIELGDRLAIPGATPAEQLLVWFGHAATLLRCCVVGWYGNSLRRELHGRNRELASAAQQISYLATHDNLTDTLRRTPVWNLIEQQPCPPPFSIAMLDLDHFKQINDRYGHVVGDDVLRLFADTVRGALRPGDAVGRYGGEEFLVLLRDAGTGSALAIAERVRRAVERANWEAIAPGLRVTVSGGVAGAKSTEPIRHLVDRADQALYAAKSAGRNCVLSIGDDGGFARPATGTDESGDAVS